MSRLWRDAAYRALFYQAAAVMGCVWLVYAALDNALTNLREKGIAPGFGFLASEAGIPIADAPAVPEDWRYVLVLLGLGLAILVLRKGISHLPLTASQKTIGSWASTLLILALIVGFAAFISWHRYQPSESFGTLVLTGMTNNIRIGIVACFLAITLGFILGICLRSTNWLLRNIVGVLTEITRNVPLLLHIMFWYTSILAFFPPVRRSWNMGDLVFFSQRGVFYPAVATLDAERLAWFGAGAAGLLLLLIYRRVERLWVCGAAVGLAAGALGVAASWEVPRLRGLNFSGGSFLSPEYSALLLGLVIYVSAFIADIVRSGINAIPKGQWEAALAIGLSRLQVIRRVIVPQALRVIVPPMANQILGLAKNTSLGVAIAYPELVAITRTVVNQTGHALEMMAIVFAFFLTINLMITSIFNYINHKLRIVER